MFQRAPNALVIRRNGNSDQAASLGVHRQLSVPKQSLQQTEHRGRVDFGQTIDFHLLRRFRRVALRQLLQRRFQTFLFGRCSPRNQFRAGRVGGNSHRGHQCRQLGNQHGRVGAVQWIRFKSRPKLVGDAPRHLLQSRLDRRLRFRIGPGHQPLAGRVLNDLGVRIQIRQHGQHAGRVGDFDWISDKLHLLSVGNVSLQLFDDGGNGLVLRCRSPYGQFTRFSIGNDFHTGQFRDLNIRHNHPATSRSRRR